MKSQKHPPQPNHQQKPSAIRNQSPFNNTNVTHKKSASKDLETYILRSSAEKNNTMTYNFKEVDKFEKGDTDNSEAGSNSQSPVREKQIKKKSSSKTKQATRHPIHQKLSISNKENLGLVNARERSISSGAARLGDLCPEDRARIGELVKKLAVETKQKQEWASKYETEKQQMEKRLKELESISVLYEDEREQMKNKFSQSLQMLQRLKEEQEKIAQEKQKKEEELKKMQQQLRDKELEVERSKVQIELEREENSKLIIAKERSQISLVGNKNISVNESSTSMNDNHAVNTLREISELKGEIMKLTTSLKNLKVSPEREKSHDHRQEESQSDEEERSVEQSWWRAQSKRPPTMRTNSQSKKTQNTSVSRAAQQSIVSLDKEDLEHLKIDDLHALQDQLAQKLELTNSLLHSKLTNSSKKAKASKLNVKSFGLEGSAQNSFRDSAEGSIKKKLSNIDNTKMAKLIEKAQNELEGYDSEQSTPKPKRAAPEPQFPENGLQSQHQVDYRKNTQGSSDDIMRQKMEIFKEIQQRVNKQGSSAKESALIDEQPERDVSARGNPMRLSGGGSFYKQLIQQQTHILHQQKQGKLVNLNSSLSFNELNHQADSKTQQERNILQSSQLQQQQCDDDEEVDDLVYSLNGRGSAYQPVENTNQVNSLQSSTGNRTHQAYQQPYHYTNQVSNQQNPSQHYQLHPQRLEGSSFGGSQTITLQAPYHQNQTHYDDSLFNIIDEIECEQHMLNQSQASEKSSTAKKPKSYFDSQLHEEQVSHIQHQPQVYTSAPVSQQQLPTQYIQPQQQLHPQYSYKNNPFYLQAKQELDYPAQSRPQVQQISNSYLSQGTSATSHGGGYQNPLPNQQQHRPIQHFQKPVSAYESQEYGSRPYNQNQQQHSSQNMGQQSFHSEINRLNFTYEDRRELEDQQYQNRSGYGDASQYRKQKGLVNSSLANNVQTSQSSDANPQSKNEELKDPQLQLELSSSQPQNQPEVSYESLVVTLKQKTQEIKKLETFKNKIEDRYKEKVKQLKTIQKERQFTEDFIKAILPRERLQLDQDNKLILPEAVESLVRLHQEVYPSQSAQVQNPVGQNGQNQQQQIDSKMIEGLLREENEGMKRKIIDLTTLLKQEQQKALSLSNNALNVRLKDMEKKVKGLEELLKEKDEQIQSLNEVGMQFQELKGKQLLQVIKAGMLSGNENTQLISGGSLAGLAPEIDEIQVLKQQLSEKTNKILELLEKLSVANETIRALETERAEQQQIFNQTPKRKASFVASKPAAILQQDNNSQIDQNATYSYNGNGVESINAGDDFEEEVDVEVQLMRARLCEMEQMNSQLMEQIEQNKNKARAMLMKKDVQIQRLKIVITKMENHLKTQASLSNEEIIRIAQLKEDEVAKLNEMEKEVDMNLDSSYAIGQQLSTAITSNLINHIERQGAPKRNEVSQESEEPQKIIEYIRNVFVKYLEYLAQNNTKEIRTIEHVLFTELRVTRDQAQRLDHLRRQNTFWKKIIPFQSSVQPIVKGKFSAGELKKKLFGGVSQMMGANGQRGPVNPYRGTAEFGRVVSNRPSIEKPPSELNQSINNASPMRSTAIYNTREGGADAVQTESQALNDSLVNYAGGGYGLMRLASDAGHLSPKRLVDVKISKFPHQI